MNAAIVAYAGRQPAAWLLLEALGLLEQHEHDVAGMAVWYEPHDVSVARVLGRIDALDRSVRGAGTVGLGRRGIGHIRSTARLVGRTRDVHPLVDCTDRVLLVHHGLVRNAESLRRALEDDGHVFLSDTDSEVIAHLVEEALETRGSLLLAVEHVRSRLEGTWALIVLDGVTGDIAASANDVPLVIARSDDGVLLASDVAAITRTASSYQELGDATVAVMHGGIHWRRDGAMAAGPQPRRIG